MLRNLFDEELQLDGSPYSQEQKWQTAIQSEDSQTLALMLTQGYIPKPINQFIKINDNELTPLHFAIAENLDAQIVLDLIINGASVLIEDKKNKMTALPFLKESMTAFYSTIFFLPESAENYSTIINNAKKHVENLKEMETIIENAEKKEKLKNRLGFFSLANSSPEINPEDEEKDAAPTRLP